MSDVESVTVKSDVLSVDLILFRRFRRYRPGLAERVYALNPGLAALGPILPVGTVFQIPLDAPNATPPERKAVRLWG